MHGFQLHIAIPRPIRHVLGNFLRRSGVCVAAWYYGYLDLRLNSGASQRLATGDVLIKVQESEIITRRILHGRRLNSA